MIWYCTCMHTVWIRNIYTFHVDCNAIFKKANNNNNNKKAKHTHKTAQKLVIVKRHVYVKITIPRSVHDCLELQLKYHSVCDSVVNKLSYCRSKYSNFNVYKSSYIHHRIRPRVRARLTFTVNPPPLPYPVVSLSPSLSLFPPAHPPPPPYPLPFPRTCSMHVLASNLYII